MDDLMNFDLSINQDNIIKVIGVGGGGGNAVNHMFRQGIKDVDFCVCNTDLQALANSPVPVRIQLGKSLTEGRGAGNKPEIGKQAAIENIDDIKEVLTGNTKMVFITAGMGGGTGTGAAPIIAKAAKEMEILTVAIVTIPFRNEGQRQINQALEGIAEIEKYVDSLLVINNEKIREIHGNLRVSEAFAKADDILAIAAKGIAEIITVPGSINVDFADVETVMKDSGVAIMGSARAEGEDRAIQAAKEALNSPLLNDNDIKGARNVLINITSGAEEVTMDEIEKIKDYVQEITDTETDLIWGNSIDESLISHLSITIIATGFGANSIPDIYIKERHLDKITLSDDHMRNNVINPSMELNEKPPSEKKDESFVKQRTIEFNISEEEKLKGVSSKFSKPVDSIKASIRMKNIKKMREELKELRFNNPENSNYIDELENEPAYKRRNINLKDIKHSEESKISKYSLSDDEDSNAKLNKDNSYLHDNVD
jgi:cell division protein FtsZ